MVKALAGAFSWLGPVALAVLHSALLWGVFERHPTALDVAAYLEDWPIAEGIALVVTPWLMQITVRDHDTPLWARIVWLPATLLALGGIVGTIRFMRATWVYFLARVPTVFYERSTKQQAEIGCARSLGALIVLVALLAVFGNRPTSWPIGTLVGRGLTIPERFLANGMAMGAAYFTVLAVADVLIHRAVRRAAAGNA